MSVPDSHGVNEIADRLQAKLDSAKAKFQPSFGKKNQELQDAVNEFKAPMEVVVESNNDQTPSAFKQMDRTPSTVDATQLRQSNSLKGSSAQDATP